MTACATTRPETISFFGGAGDDTINAGADTDTVDAGTGDDTVIFDGDYEAQGVVATPEVMDGGEGTDTLVLSPEDNRDLTVDMSNTDANGFFSIRDFEAGTQIARSFENLISAGGDDSLTGTDGDNIIIGDGAVPEVEVTDLTQLLNGQITVSASSNWDANRFSEQFLIDGSTSTGFAHTLRGPNEFFELDFGQAINATQILLSNRADGVGERLNGAEVVALDVNGNEVYRSAPITGAETGEIIAISLPSGIEASTFRVEHSTNYLHLTEIQVLGYPADPTVATAGDDTIDGGAGDDLIIGDGIDAVVRESFNWDQFNNQQIDDARSAPFVQNTGNVNVSFTRPSDNTNHDGFVGTNDNNVSGIDSGGEVANDESTLGSLHTGHGGFGQFQWDFSEEVSDVSFRINDIDQGSIVAVRAFDANGNQVVVDYDLGAGLQATESDGVAGAETIRYFGSNHPNPSATASENSVLVSVEGPIARLLVDHAGDSGGVNVTDIFFDAPVCGLGRRRRP